MTSVPISELVLKGPVIAQWGDKNRIDTTLHSAVIDIHGDRTRCTFYCKLRISVRVMGSARKVYMYLILDPKHIRSLEICNGVIPQDVVNAFVTGNHCSSSESILTLQLSLSCPGTIVYPGGESNPKKESRKIVELLFLLSQNDDITLYVPSKGANQPCLLDLKDKLNNSLLKPNPGLINTLYAGRGCKIVSSLDDFWPSAARDCPDESEPLPAYEQIASGSSQPQPQLEKRPILSSDEENSPWKKKRRGQTCKGNESWKHAFALLAAEVTAMRQEMHAGRIRTVDAAVQTFTPPTPNNEIQAVRAISSPSQASTIEDSVEDRLLLCEDGLAAARKDASHLRGLLETKLTNLQESFHAKLAQSTRHTAKELTQKIEQCFDERTDQFDGLEEQLADLRSDVSENLRNLLEDEMSYMKLEMRDFIQEETKDVRDTLKEDIRLAVSRASLHVEFDD